MSFTLVLGPMMAGKSTHLASVINRHRSIGNTVLVVNHVNDNRYGSDALATHDGLRLQCLFTDSLCALFKLDLYKQAQCIVVEEAQFFASADAARFIQGACDIDHKHVTAAGLQGDRFRQPWHTISTLLPYADTIVPLRALCHECRDGTPASFTASAHPPRDALKQVAVGTDYRALCRRHYEGISAQYADHL